MQTLTNCPLCKATAFVPYISCNDFTVSNRTFNIVKCSHCSFLFTNPRPDENEIGTYYESDDYVSHSNTNKGAINKLYQVVRNYSIRQKVAMMNSFKIHVKTMIDIGCGTGEFLNAMKQSGWKVQGLEPGDRARNFAKDHYKLNVQNLDAFYSLPQDTFGLITMWHVMEHVHDLDNYVKQLKNLLIPEGVLIVAVPNAGAFEASVYKECWAAYDVPRHLNHFTIETMTRLMNQHRFRIEKIKLMPFDSFYISMLSEKYKKTGFIKMMFNSIINGMKSNSAARNDLHHASSLIYIIRHEE